jgi:hypothetical protein
MARFCSQSKFDDQNKICRSMNAAHRIAATIETTMGMNGLASLSVTTTHLHTSMLVTELFAYKIWRRLFDGVSILNHDFCFIIVNSFALTYQVPERHHHA